MTACPVWAFQHSVYYFLLFLKSRRTEWQVQIHSFSEDGVTLMEERQQYNPVSQSACHFLSHVSTFRLLGPHLVLLSWSAHQQLIHWNQAQYIYTSSTLTHCQTVLCSTHGSPALPFSLCAQLRPAFAVCQPAFCPWLRQSAFCPLVSEPRVADWLPGNQTAFRPKWCSHLPVRAPPARTTNHCPEARSSSLIH